MAELSFTGATTYGDATTSVVREVPIFKSFPTRGGVVSGVDITTSLRVSATENFTFTIYLFKTFNCNSSYWAERSCDTGYSYDCYYQYPSSTSYYLTASMIGDVLASKSFTQSVATQEYTFSLDLTDYGKSLSNWSGDVYMAIVPSANDLYWENSSSSTLVLTYNGGVIRYAINGSYVPCEVYYGTGGSYKMVSPMYGTGGKYVEIGG